MKRAARQETLALAISATLGLCATAEAVTLNPDGRGQALIYPYYTARSSGANPFHTYVSVLNGSLRTSAVRVRFREARAGREVAGFNVFLAPGDMWTGAVVPSEAGAQVVSADVSCTDPPFAGTGGLRAIPFGNALYSGANDDGHGTSLDRAREGYIEMIEMASLTGVAAGNVAHGAATGVPHNCAAIVGVPVPLTVEAPTGQLSGTATYINVATGMDFTVNADALAGLSTAPFFRVPGDAYPDFNAAEVTPISIVVDGGSVYRSLWTRGVDAVSAVLMRESASGEYVRDASTRSQTDIVVTAPTRRFHVQGTGGSSPFPSACLNLVSGISNRAQAAIRLPNDFLINPEFPVLCGAMEVASIARTGESAATSSRVFGSRSLLRLNNGGALSAGDFENGVVLMDTPFLAVGRTLVSLPGSTRIDAATGSSIPGSHTFRGIPQVGFAARTFENGTLSCSAVACQGNYGGAFPMTFTRRIDPAP